MKFARINGANNLVLEAINSPLPNMHPDMMSLYIKVDDSVKEHEILDLKTKFSKPIKTKPEVVLTPKEQEERNVMDFLGSRETKAFAVVMADLVDKGSQEVLNMLESAYRAQWS